MGRFSNSPGYNLACVCVGISFISSWTRQTIWMIMSLVVMSYVKIAMYRHIKWHELAGARTWFLLALIFGGLFLAFTAIYTTGALDMATLVVEQRMIGRPLIQFDCVLVEWKNFGAALVNLVFIALLGVACGLTHYRWRVLPYLVILVLISIATEAVGKQLFALPLPPMMRSGMVALACPQAGQSPLLHLQLGLGMWWKAPLPTLNVQSWRTLSLRCQSTAVLVFSTRVIAISVVTLYAGGSRASCLPGCSGDT